MCRFAGSCCSPGALSGGRKGELQGREAKAERTSQHTGGKKTKVLDDGIKRKSCTESFNH